MMQGSGVEVPESVSYQANYDAEEAELQRAIAESKALMEAMDDLHKDEMQQLTDNDSLK
jgi:hypothetical protein